MKGTSDTHGDGESRRGMWGVTFAEALKQRRGWPLACPCASFSRGAAQGALAVDQGLRIPRAPRRISITFDMFGSRYHLSNLIHHLIAYDRLMETVWHRMKLPLLSMMILELALKDQR